MGKVEVYRDKFLSITLNLGSVDKKAHAYAVKELEKKYKPKERISFLEYLEFYSKGLKTQQ